MPSRGDAPSSKLVQLRPVLLVLCLMMAAGCAPAEDTTYLTPIPDATLDAYKEHWPVENRLEAVIIARLMLHWHRIETATPQVLYAEETTMSEAVAHLYSSDGAPHGPAPEDRVWLVVFRGKWLILAPPNPDGTSSDIPYEGCAYAMFPADGTYPQGAGDAPCPP